MIPERSFTERGEKLARLGDASRRVRALAYIYVDDGYAHSEVVAGCLAAIVR